MLVEGLDASSVGGCQCDAGAGHRCWSSDRRHPLPLLHAPPGEEGASVKNKCTLA